MPAKLLVGNLPPDTTESDIKNLFLEVGAEIEVLSIDGESDKLVATVQLDMEQSTAQVLADRSRRRMFRGRELTVYAPRFMK